MATVTEFNPSACTNIEGKNAEYLIVAFEEDGPGVLLAAIGHLTKARGMSGMAEDPDLGRDNPYKAFASGAKPGYGAMQKFRHSLGIKINVSAA